ncbi:MAG TPA: DUF3343 domain-containing protein [Candidatus Limiplasma sp.]|jgi:hypothetical protein|nr:DUF3343 domain-containing protein [Candidatus Limiplasma sp.]HPR78535.1 DUF3343 domain-containing protein [Candidatus Limiplasma sp.]
MNRYIATFHTHYAALATYRALQAAGWQADMAPVPRALSADCGTCVIFRADEVPGSLLHKDYDRVALAPEGEAYCTVMQNDTL